MAELLAPAVSLPATGPDDRRVGHLLGSALGRSAVPRAVLVGFPSDEGVRRNGGRPGAAAGPAAIRQALYRMTPDAFDLPVHTAVLASTRDLGDLAVSGDLEGDQAALAEVLAPHLSAGTFGLVLGGGHETAYGHFLALVGAGLRPEILNLDAHPDVRDLRGGLGHSGSPFRQALTHPSGACRRYRVAGLQPQSVARSHLAWLEARGGRALPGDQLSEAALRRIFAELSAPAMATFDLDAVDQSAAPGVSAPAPRGMSAGLWLAAARLAGRTPAVASADVCELCPAHDADGRTARLAALTAWEILRGLGERPPSGQ